MISRDPLHGIPLTLDERTIEKIAERTDLRILENLYELGRGIEEHLDRLEARLEQLTETPSHHVEPQLVDAAEMARILNVHRDTIYEHKHLLGGIPIGDGKRPRWRFDPHQARETWMHRSRSERSPEDEPPAQPAKPRRRRRATAGCAPELLPVHGPVVPFPGEPGS